MDEFCPPPRRCRYVSICSAVQPEREIDGHDNDAALKEIRPDRQKQTGRQRGRQSRTEKRRVERKERKQSNEEKAMKIETDRGRKRGSRAHATVREREERERERDRDRDRETGKKGQK